MPRYAGRTFPGKPIKEICRELPLSRKVVGKSFAERTEFRCEQSRQPLARIGPGGSGFKFLLEENESKAARERLTLVRLYEELRGLGFEGGYVPSAAMRSPGARSARARRRAPMCR